MNKIRHLKYCILLVLMAISFNYCNDTSPKIAVLNTGDWVFTLYIDAEDPGVILPFNVKVIDPQQLIISNADEEIIVKEITYYGDSLSIIMPVFGSEFKGKITGNEIKGFWYKYNYSETYKIPFTASFNVKKRFSNVAGSSSKITGNWQSYFIGKSGDSSDAIGIFRQDGDRVVGTFLTEVGDYRHLEGVMDGNMLRLSTFDGAHAFLFEANVAGDQLNGYFKSGHRYTAEWTAHKVDDPQLGDMRELTYLNPDYDKLEFSFPDLDGNMISLADDTFKDKVVIVQIFGTWCPNCMDETRFLVELYQMYHGKGLEIIGLDFEIKPGMEYFRSRVKRFKKDLNVPYPVLLAGPASKEKAAESLPMLNHILSYPTAIFIDRKGQIREIHTGFTGPGTGDYYIKYSEEVNQLVQNMLSE